MIPLVSCPYCTRMIKLRRRHCHRDFVHAECGATVRVPKLGDVRRGVPLTLVSPPENSFTDAMDPLPEPMESAESGVPPREARDCPNPGHTSDALPPSAAEIAELAATVRELTERLAKATARLLELSSAPDGAESQRRTRGAGAADGANGNVAAQASHAVLVKGRSDSAALKDAYRSLEDVDELRESNEEAVALKDKQREKAREMMLRKTAPWEAVQEPGEGGAARSRLPWKIVMPSASLLIAGGFGAAIVSRHAPLAGDAARPPQHSYQQVLSTIAAAQGGAEKIALISANIDTVKQGVNNATVGAFLDDYIAARTWRGRLAYVRKPDTVRPLMERYYAAHPLRRGTIDQVQRVAFARSGDLAFVDVSAIDNSGARISAALEIVDGKFHLDWESFTAYSDIALADFLQHDAGSSAVFRVKAEPSVYFNYSFNSQQHVVLRIEEPFTGTSCHGYVVQHSELRDDLTDMLIQRQNANDRVIRPMLRLQIPAEKRGDNQVWIEAIESDSWVTP